MRLYHLASLIEQDECGYHAVVIDAADDSVLWITNSFNRAEDAERAASDWTDRQQPARSPAVA